MKINRKLQKEIALAVLSMIEPEYNKLSRDDQKLLFNNMKKGVHKFILKEYHRMQSLKENNRIEK
jgi:ribonuclease HIII